MRVTEHEARLRDQEWDKSEDARLERKAYWEQRRAEAKREAAEGQEAKL